MNREVFWELIDRTRATSGGDPHRQADLLVEELVRYSAQEIIEYDAIYQELEDRAYIADLWAAAAVIDSWGCSDDGFVDFRAWLIAQGKEVYEKTLDDPESLADIVEVGMETQIEVLSYVALRAYERKTGHTIPPLSGYKLPQLRGKLPPNRESSKQKYPRLAAKFRDDIDS